MTFLSHSIPWLSLSHLFEYHAPRSRPGPQEADLYCEERPAHRKQLEHFARTFQKTVREHGLIERGRYSTAQAYRDRAAIWTESSVDEPHEQGQNAESSSATHARWDTKDPIETTTDVRTAASSSPETRRVYPAHYADTYMSLVSPTSGGAYGREGLLASLADITTWIDHRRRASDQGDSLDEETENKIWLDNKSCSDVLKLLLIDAGTTDDEAQRKKCLSTLLLLANHPGVGLDGFKNDGMWCCNIVVGLSALVEKTVMAFIYLNLILALTGDYQDAELLRPCESLEEFKPSQRHGLDTITHLLPRPAYMNTRSFNCLLENLLDEHGHAVEHVLFNPIFAPRPSGRLSKWLTPGARSVFERDPDDEARFERDVMADRQRLGEALKHMWRVLIFCDMIFCEADTPINWERFSLGAIAQLFRRKTGVNKLLGQDWNEYRMDRQEEGSFTFYAESGKD
jgi:hypothetical protein